MLLATEGLEQSSCSQNFERQDFQNEYPISNKEYRMTVKSSVCVT